MKRAAVLPTLAVSLLLVPAASRAQFNFKKPSPEQQIKLGRQAADELRRKEHVLPQNEPRVRVLRRVGQRLLSTIHENLPWEFTFDVIESKEVNAFALPGGSVFFYTGLLDRIKTEDELAGVLGHEMTHVLKEHWARRQAEANRRNLLLTGALIFGHASNTTAGLAGLGNDVFFNLRFSRRDEDQADQGGFDLLTDAGYNPQGEADVFRMLGSLGGKQPEFLSDHPSDKNRVNRIETMAHKAGKDYPPQTPLRP